MTRPRPTLSPPAKIALSFLLFGVLWIFVSDSLVEAAFPDAGASPPAQTIKGLAFVALSSLLVLVLAAREHRRKKRLLMSERERDTLATALEQTAEGIALTDSNGRIDYVNPAFSTMTGYAWLDVIGTRPTHVAPPHTIQRPQWVDLAAHGSWKGRVIHTRKDGVTYTADLHITRIADRTNTSRFVVIERDVSREIDLERKLLQSQKMEAIGRLAGGIAHDFNNILTAISGFTSLAIESLPPDANAREDLGQVVDAAGRAKELTRKLLGFARKQTAQPKILELSRTIAPMLDLLRRVIGENIQLVTDLPSTPALGQPSHGLVRIDPTQLDQIVTNLVVNARDAIQGPTGRIQVTVRNASIPRTPSDSIENIEDASDHVVLEVSDDGQGMTTRTLEHIFEPFFTTKAEGAGTGLGLATVYGIVEQNGGFIDVRSEPGKGTTFLVHLPRHIGAVTLAVPTDPEPRPTPFSGHLLVVEDDDLLRVLVERLLTSAGYLVTTAASPHEALKLAQDTSFDLLLTDVIMPGMNGHQLHLALTATQPGLRCLYMSGYPRDVIANQGIVAPDIDLLTKPFSHDVLLRKVAEALGASSPM